MIDETLTALTDIKMPHYAPLAQASGSIDLNGTILPEYCCNTLVLGSGAAGWRAAVELKRQNVDVMVASSKPSLMGKYRCSRWENVMFIAIKRIYANHGLYGNERLNRKSDEIGGTQ